MPRVNAAAFLTVIPAQAGIQWRECAVIAKEHDLLCRDHRSVPLLDSRLRRNDGEGNECSGKR
ncbi:hypothetical protein GCM10027021_04300 [Dyella kyungheensis]|jgi:hypothetical protein